MIFQALVVLYASAALYVILSHENFICVTQFTSVPDKVNVVFAFDVYVAWELIIIVPVGAVVSIFIVLPVVAENPARSAAYHVYL